MAGVVTLSKFNPQRKQKPHKVMGPDGRFYFKGRPLVGPQCLKSKAKRSKPPYVPTGKPTGFPKGHKKFGGKEIGFTQTYKLKDLILAIKDVEDERAINAELGDDELLTHFVKRAFKSDTVLKDLMKKLLPDLKHVEADIDVTEQFQLIIDATGEEDEEDTVDAEIITQKALPAPKRRVKRKRKSA